LRTQARRLVVLYALKSAPERGSERKEPLQKAHLLRK
jgi:hypothetical protein